MGTSKTAVFDFSAERFDFDQDQCRTARLVQFCIDR
jgi:hypothetical protein